MGNILIKADNQIDLKSISSTIKQLFVFGIYS